MNDGPIETMGSGAPRLVALHGIQGTRAAWRPVASLLADEASVVLPNLRGCGQAPRGHGAVEHGLADYAQDLHRVLQDKVGGQPFFLAGWSMGVSVVLEYLQRADAQKPVGLILLSGTPWLAGTRWFSGDGEELLARIAARERRLGLHEAADHAAVAWTWTAIRDTDQRALLPAIDLPALILHGRADDDSPWAHAEMLAAGLAGAQLVGIEGAGHSLLTQHTELVAREMRRFIGSLAS